jgi:hypothetical protein
VRNAEKYVVLILTSFPAMDTDKIKIFGARVKVDGTGKLAELERAERVSALPDSSLCCMY